MDKHGEGFHHIAFEVSDLDKEVARWSALGFPFIQGGAWGEKGKPGWGRFAYQNTDAIAGAELDNEATRRRDIESLCGPEKDLGIHLLIVTSSAETIASRQPSGRPPGASSRR